MLDQVCEQLTLSPEVFPASPFPWLESRKVKKTTVTYGRKCSELSESLRRVGLSVRTYLESCDLPGGQFVRTWSVKDTLSPYLILKLRLSERPTGESGSHLWPTPNTPNGGRSVAHVTDWRSDRTAYHNGRKVQVDLNAAVKMWPTPCATEARQGLQIRRDGKKGSQQSLSTIVRMLPTPRAQMHKAGCPSREGKCDLQQEIGGQLNPTWVEWLMGFPLGWTDLSA